MCPICFVDELALEGLFWPKERHSRPKWKPEYLLIYMEIYNWTIHVYVSNKLFPYINQVKVEEINCEGR